MREILFRKLLGRLEKHTPGFLRSLQSQILLDMTARAYGVPGKMIWYRNPEQTLREYAGFTLSCMTSLSAKPSRLYREAYAVGARIRHVTGFTNHKDLCRLVFYLYSNIGISMQGEIPGELTVSACYFSHFYNPDNCRLMSYMDWGIIAGIYGSGRLRFTQRIPEGCQSCKACFSQKQKTERSSS